MTQNILDLSFADFDKAATERGYKATQYSQTGFFVKSANGVRCELQKTKGGVNSIGYGSSQAIVDLLKAAVNSVAGPKNHKIAELKGSVNFAHESIEKFFELVTFTETVKLPEAKGKGGRPAGSTQPKKVTKVTKPVAPKADAPKQDVSALMTATDTVLDEAAKASLEHVKGPSLDAIKAANLARLREVGESRKKKQAEAKAKLDEDVNALLEDFEMPAFLTKDAVMSDAKKDGAE